MTRQLRQAAQPAPQWISRGRIPGLDGLRALSISLVLLAHAVFAVTQSNSVLVFGLEGVDAFFVISGFLITLLLLREQQRAGHINLLGFYRRRAFRILPAWATYLLAIYVASRLGWVTAKRGDWLAALTYTMNWRSDSAWILGHLWSLSMEEQFYLLWPLLFIVLSYRRALGLLICCIMAAPIYRVAMRALLPQFEAAGRTSFPARMEPIAAGCLLALLASTPDGLDLLRRWLGGRLRLGAAFILLAACTVLAIRSKIFNLVARPTCCALLLAAIVWGCASTANSMLGRFLAWKPVVVIGVLSYSIYLWQQPFLDHANLSPLGRFPLNIGISLAVAACSYVLIERPMLMLKERRHVPESTLPPSSTQPAAADSVELIPASSD